MRILSLTALALAFGAPAFAASPGQADICHWSDDSGTASVITVSVKAVSAHVANHGDSYAAIYFSDADGDGYGDAAGTTDRCPNEGFVANNTDCDDADADVNPGATEVAYDGVDNDCADGTRDDDLDNDGFLLADDCDDDDATVNPGAEDVCDDAVDNNCDGTIDENCAGDCPCFTAADIDAAYAEHLAVDLAGYAYSWSYAQCYEQIYSYTYGGGGSYSQDYTYVYFDAYGQGSGYGYEEGDEPTMDPNAYERTFARFYGISYEDAYSGSANEYAYCSSYSNSYAYDGVNYTSDYQNVYLPITPDEAEACEAVVADWAADNAMTCPTYTYTYAY